MFPACSNGTPVLGRCIRSIVTGPEHSGMTGRLYPIAHWYYVWTTEAIQLALDVQISLYTLCPFAGS